MSFDLAINNLQQRQWQTQPFAAPVPIADLPTPALLINEALLDANIAKMADYLGDRKVGFRPHSKTHKCPVIAHKQMAAGAVGICTAKLSEALVMVEAGLNDVLITSPLASASKIAVLADLSTRANGLAIVVDQVANLELIIDALSTQNSTQNSTQGSAQDSTQGQLGIVVDVDVAMGRTGTRSLDTMLQIAKLAEAHSQLHFVGLQHYAGHVMHIDGFAERQKQSLALWEQVAERVATLEANGLAPKIVSGAGTGTYNIDSAVPCITDLQVGSYIFMDQEYLQIGSEHGAVFNDFEVSLTLAATGISQPMAERAFTVDAGYKSFASDSVNPEPIDLPGAKFRFGGDEHGIVVLPKPGGDAAPIDSNNLVGRVHQFVTPHCDPTVNLHDYYYVHDGEMVYEAWPITGRGCSW